MFIEFKNIDHFYGKKQILFDVSFSVKKGETLFLLGSSGAGKSTLLRMFNLLEMPKKGTIKIDAQFFDFNKKSPTENELISLRKKVGMVFQQYNLWPHKNVLENMIIAPMYVLKLSKKEAIERAKFILNKLSISELANAFPHNLSGGQQQRVALGRTFMMEPEIILFDEPTAALDPEITSQITTIIDELSQTNITQIIVSHDVFLAKKLATNVIFLKNGEILERGDQSILFEPKTKDFHAFLSF